MGIDSSADLLFRIGADPSDAITNIARFRSLMSKDLAGIGAEFSGWANKVFGSMSTMQGAMTAGVAGGLAGLAALTVAAVEIGKALWSAGEKAVKYAEEIEIGMHKTGLSAEALSGLRYAAKNTHLDYEELVASLTKFSTAMVKAEKETSLSGTAFGRLGITQQDLRVGNENLLPLLYKVADAFRSHADGAAKAAAARELFGKSGQREIAFLNLGTAGLKMYADEAQRLGRILTEYDIVAAKSFRLEMIALNAELEGLKLSIGKGVLPVMGELTVMMEAYLRTAPKVFEIYKNKKWWEDLIPGQAEITTLHAGMKIWEEELAGARERLAARLRAAMAQGGEALPAPEVAKVAKEAAQEWWGFSGILDGVKSKLAGVGTEEEKIAQETLHLGYEVQKAGAEFNKLRAEEKLAPETVAREMAALAQMAAKVGELAGAEVKTYQEKRNAAMLAAAEQLRDRLAALQIQTFDQQRAGVDAQWARDVAEAQKRKEYEGEIITLLAAIREAGHEQIDRDEHAAYIQQMAGLQGHLRAMLTAHATAAERLALQYQEDLLKANELEEVATLSVEKNEQKRQEIRDYYAAVRRAAADRYTSESRALARTQGLEGLFTGVFAEAIRGNEQMVRDFTYSTPSKINLVSVAFEAMNQSATRAFGSMARGMGQNIAQAIVYQKSIGEAIRTATASALEGLGAECLAYAIYSAGLGFLRLAQFLPGSAAQAFQAAGLFGAGGIAASVIGRAIAPPQSAASSGSAASSAASSGSATSASESAAAGAGRPYIQINVAGHIVGRAGIEELTEIINEAVKDRDVRLIATQVKQAQRFIV